MSRASKGRRGSRQEGKSRKTHHRMSHFLFISRAVNMEKTRGEPVQFKSSQVKSAVWLSVVYV